MGIAAEDVVRALAIASGGIPPDPERIEHIVREIGDDPRALVEIAARLRADAEREIVKQAVLDHSQWGEFRLILRALVDAVAAPGIVVDVGAKGRAGSNSYDLVASFGWRGVLIEAQPARAERLRAEFGEGDYRIVQCAVGVDTGTRPLYLGQEGFIASLSRDMAVQFGGVGDFIEVEVRRLCDILDEAAVPHRFDLLSIDVEGLDIAVLNDLIERSPYRPRWVIVEVVHEFRHPFEALGFTPAVLAGYREIARTLPNLILARID